jgi:hypothetical protein
MMAQRDGERIRLLTRNGHDWSERLPAVVAAVSQLEVKSYLIDGEAVVCDEQGLAVFKLLRNGGRVKHDAHLIAFDLIELDRRDLQREPIEVRKAELTRLARHASAGLQLCDHIDLPGDLVFAHACKLSAPLPSRNYFRDAAWRLAAMLHPPRQIDGWFGWQIQVAAVRKFQISQTDMEMSFGVAAPFNDVACAHREPLGKTIR